MKQIEDCMRRTGTGVAAAFGATAKIEFPDIFAPLANNPAETKFTANAAADIVGEAHVDRNRSLITAAEALLICLRLAPALSSILATPAPSAAAPCTTRITISTTLHCQSELAYSRDWWRKSCHDFRLDEGGLPVHLR